MRHRDRNAVDRKERQLCRQAYEAASLAFAEFEDPFFLDVEVVSVEPAPDASRLAVVVRAPSDADPRAVYERLQALAGRVRTEVAGAIERKRVPSIAFRVLVDASN